MTVALCSSSGWSSPCKTACGVGGDPRAWTRRNLGRAEVGCSEPVATSPFSGIGWVSNVPHAWISHVWHERKSSLRPAQRQTNSALYPCSRPAPPSAFLTHLKFLQGHKRSREAFRSPPAPFYSDTSPALPVGAEPCLQYHTCCLHSLLECHKGGGVWVAVQKGTQRKKRGKSGAAFRRNFRFTKQILTC